MSIEVTITNGFCHSRIEGEMTIYTVAEHAGKLRENCDTQNGMALDLEKVTEIDSSGVQLLVALKKQLEGTESGLSLKNPSKSVQEVLMLTNLVSMFDKHDVKESA